MSSVSEDRETDRKFPNRYIRLPRPFLEIVVSKTEKTDRDYINQTCKIFTCYACHSTHQMKRDKSKKWGLRIYQTRDLMNQSGKEEFQDNNFTFQKRSQSRWNQERSLCQGVHLQREKWLQ